MDLLGDLAYRRVFTTPTIYKMEIAESVILNFLMDKFVEADESNDIAYNKNRALLAWYTVDPNLRKTD